MIAYDKVIGCILGTDAGDTMGAATETRTIEMILLDFDGFLSDIAAPPDGRFARRLAAVIVTDGFSLGYYATWELSRCPGKVNGILAKKCLCAWADDPRYRRIVRLTTQRTISAMNGEALSDPDAYPAYNNCQATNGTAMKIFGAGPVHPGKPRDTAETAITLCLPTYPYDAALSGACAVSAAMLPAATLDHVLAAGFEGTRQGYQLGAEKGLPCAVPSVVRRMELAIDSGQDAKGLEPTLYDPAQIIGSGISISASVPCVIGILTATNGTVMLSIKMGINIWDDTDTIATMAATITGAPKGGKEIPEHYLALTKQVDQFDLHRPADSVYEGYYHEN